MSAKKTSLKFKVTGLVLLAALLPLLLFYLLGVQNFLLDMKGVLARELGTKASLAAKDLDRFIEQRIIDTKTISRARVLSSEDNKEITRYLQDVVQENPWINEIDLLDENGFLVAHSSEEAIEPEPIWEEYPQLKHLWASDITTNLKDVFVSETENLHNGEGAGVLFLAKTTLPQEVTSSHTLLVGLAFKDIESIVVNFSEALESDKHIYVVQNDGTVMVTDDPAILPFQTFPDINQHPHMLSFFSEPAAEGILHYVNSHGEPLTAAYIDLSEFGDNQGLDWSIIAVAADNSFFSSINTSKHNLVIIGLILSGIMAILAYILSSKITRPLLTTVNAVKEFEKGNFSAQLPLEGSSETILLAQAFNNMARQITTRTEELEEEITERKSIEEDLIESNAVKNEFIATASHELRTPLSTVIGYAELLIENDEFSEDDKREFLQYIYDKAFTLDRIVDELLDVSRIETGRALSIMHSQVKVAEICKQVAGQFQKEGDTCSFIMSFDNEDLELNADKGKLFQVFENLIGNAVKFSPDGGKITITGEQHKTHYKVSVADKGMGIEPEDQKLVFDKFYRVDATDTAIQGLGIGLYLTKNIIGLHNGRIWLESLPGKGSTFSFTLPLQGA